MRISNVAVTAIFPTTTPLLMDGKAYIEGEAFPEAIAEEKATDLVQPFYAAHANFTVSRKVANVFELLSRLTPDEQWALLIDFLVRYQLPERTVRRCEGALHNPGERLCLRWWTSCWRRAPDRRVKGSRWTSGGIPVELWLMSRLCGLAHTLQFNARGLP